MGGGDIISCWDFPKCPERDDGGYCHHDDCAGVKKSFKRGIIFKPEGTESGSLGWGCVWGGVGDIFL